MPEMRPVSSPGIHVPSKVAAGNGQQFLSEIREQPRALARLLEHEREFERVATLARERSTSVVRMVGHGSSDNAASYGVYAFGILPGWTALRDSISLAVYYGTRIDMRRSTVIGLSQSGQTPDVVDYVEYARKAGSFTIAITNEPESDLGLAADAVLPLSAGAEKAIEATKTYTNQVAALGLLAAHVAGVGANFVRDLRVVIDQLETLIPDLERQIGEIASSFAFAGRMFVIGRGVELATAREIALKLMESCRIAAEPLTVTDLAHGPVAALDPLFPVWIVASADQTLPAVVEAAGRIRNTGATLLACGDAAGEIGGADYIISLPSAPSPLLSPLLSVIPGQLFAWSLACAKGIDADRPRGLNKVTLAL
jgi:glucosamine--fructose-6-phosphate aminotransferase (isomerizing)